MLGICPLIAKLPSPLKPLLLSLIYILCPTKQRAVDCWKTIRGSLLILLIDLFWLLECHYYLIFLGRWLSWTRSIRRGWNINMLWKRCYQFLFLIMKWSIFYLASCEIFECQKIQPQFKNMLTDDRGVLLLYVVEMDAKSAATFWLLMNFEFKIYDLLVTMKNQIRKFIFQTFVRCYVAIPYGWIVWLWKNNVKQLKYDVWYRLCSTF